MSRRKTNPWWKAELSINTKKEVEDKIRSIVKSSQIGEPIDGSNKEFIEKILSHHHRFEQKCGVGIKHLVIRSNESWNGPTQGIWIIRNDDTEVDISWVTSLKPDGKPSEKEEASNAARYEIAPQIHDFHENGNCSKCELCQIPMVRGHRLHVDHIRKFEDLFKEFLDSKRLEYSDIQTDDLGVESQFKDRSLAQEWISYHQEKSTLRLVHKSCNLQRH